ncbi:MAG: hypothetical protein GKR96_08790 [Gammaproteobacteria bacterium]|nr:hypothetical protein [Gammaproteobacteria bacterium]
MTPYEIITPESYVSMPWKNGLGTTVELLKEGLPNGSENSFGWRLSMADVTQDGAFSCFTGYDRTLLLLQGVGMTLDFGQGRTAELNQYLQSTVFRGEDATSATLHKGPIKDFNLMTAREHYISRVDSGHSADEYTLDVDGDVLVIYAPDTELHIKSADGGEVSIPSQHLLRMNHPSYQRLVVNGGSFICRSSDLS